MAGGFYKRQNGFEVNPLCPSSSPSTGSAVGSLTVEAAPAANPQPELELPSRSVVRDGSMLSPALRLLKDYTPLECKGEGGVSSAPGLSPPGHGQGQVSPSHAALPGEIKPILQPPLFVLEQRMWLEHGWGLRSCQG